MQKPKVLHLASWFPSANEPTLGNFVQRHLEAIACQLPTTVICTGVGQPKIEDLQQNGVRIIRVYYAAKWPVISQLQAYFKGLQYLNKQGFQYNLVHVHVSYPAGLAAIFLKRSVLISEHFSGFQAERKYAWGFFEKKLTLLILKKAQLLMPVSQTLGEAIENFGYKGPFIPISNVVNIKIFNYKKLLEQKPEPRFLHLSSLQNETKNVTGLLNAAAALRKQNFAFTLAIGGDGDLKWLKAEIAKRQLQSCTEILPNLLPNQVADEMRKASAFVLFSHVESQGVVLLESLCCGTPVIGPKVGGVPEIISPERGLLVSPNDEAALTKALQQIVNYPFNASQVAKLAQAQYGIDAISQKFIMAYTSALRLNA
jgi:glycosyltransferase involved in cell wall biosynthesis